MENIYITKIIRVGDSCAVIVPVPVLKGLKWQRGDFVVFGFLEGDRLFVKRISDLEIKNLKSNDIN
jgi:hypothetical protein